MDKQRWNLTSKGEWEYNIDNNCKIIVFTTGADSDKWNWKAKVNISNRNLTIYMDSSQKNTENEAIDSALSALPLISKVSRALTN